MFEDGYITPSGVRIYTALSHNLAGADVTDSDDPQVQDLIKKYGARGRELFSEHSEDSLSWSCFHALSKLPTKDWLVDLFRVAVNDTFAKRCAPHVHLAEIRFWQEHRPTELYLTWLKKRVDTEGEASINHLERYEDKVRARKRLERLMAGDPREALEHPTEVDIRVTLGKELLVFIEAKLFSDASTHGTFSPGRNQIIRNAEMVADEAHRLGFADHRFILLTLDRNPQKAYTKFMMRYRSSDMRSLRRWDEIGNFHSVKEDLPHRTEDADVFAKAITVRMGWLLWCDVWKLLAHYSRKS